MENVVALLICAMIWVNISRGQLEFILEDLMKIRFWWMVGFGMLSVAVMPVIANDTIDGLLEKARSKETQGDLESAASFYRQALERDDKNIKARQGLAAVLIESQIRDPHSEHPLIVENLIEEHKDNAAFPSARFPLGFLANGALNAGEESMHSEVLLILTQLQKGDNQGAIRVSENLRKKYPSHPVPYNLLGLAWQGVGNPTKARDFFQKALSEKKDFHAARINLAELELHLGEFSNAHQELKTVLKTDKNNRRACLAMAHLYTVEGKSKEAKQWYQKASVQF